MQGGNDNDYIDGGDDDDWLFGGSGTNTLIGGAGNDSLTGDDGYNVLYGGSGNDVMNNIAGLMYGGDGDDRLSPRDQTRGIVAYGEDGDDIITDASQANDWIDGGAGADNLYSGGTTDRDVFVFSTINFGNDRIGNFTVGNSFDVLMFSTSIFADEAAVRAAAVSNRFDTTINSGANTIFLPGVDINAMTSANFDFF